MYDVIIIGAGPAGISASLYARRSNLDVLVLYNGISNLEKATKIDNYYGFPNGIEGKDLFNEGIKQAQNLGVNVIHTEVVSIENYNDLFKVNTPNENYETKAVIISTGNQKVNPNIKGIKEFEGKGISYCAICDAFFYKNKRIGIIGNGEFAISEAKTLTNVTQNITIFTNGDDIKECDFKVNRNKIQEITGDTKVNGIMFEDGSTASLDGIFIALGEAGAIDFAKTLGIITDGNNIRVNDNMETNVKGVYACGNVTGGLQQISKAVYEGSKAGLATSKYIKEEFKNG